MRIIISIIILIQICLTSFGQNDTIYFNSEGKIIIKELASFYRVLDLDTLSSLPIGNFQDFSIDSKKIISSGSYSIYGKHGIFRQNDFEETPILEFSFKDNRPDGMWYKYLSSSDTAYQLKFDIEGMKIIQCRDTLLNKLLLNGNGKFQKVLEGIIIEGEVRNFKMSGTWTLRQNGKIIFKEKYSKGDFKEGKQVINGFEYSESKIDAFIKETFHFEVLEKLEISNIYRKRDYLKLHNSFVPVWNKHRQDEGFMIVEDRGGFPGGNDYLIQYLETRLRYPKEAEENNISGRVIVEFTVDIDGQVKDPMVISSLGYGCDEVVLDIMKYMPDWIPGQQRGNPIAMQYKLPIHFGK